MEMASDSFVWHRRMFWRSLMQKGFLKMFFKKIIALYPLSSCYFDSSVHLFHLTRTPEKRICLHFRITEDLIFAIFAWIFVIFPWVVECSLFREFFFLKEYFDSRLFPGQFSKKLLTDSFFFSTNDSVTFFLKG